MKKIIFYFKYYTITFLRYFFIFVNGGEKCVVCGKHTDFFPVCRKCLKEKFSLNEVLNVKRCIKCGRELISSENDCLQCRENSILQHTNQVVPLFSYRLWNKELMFLWKQEGIRTLSNLFAYLIARCMDSMKVKIIVPVPPRPGKIREKGWDQIDELTEILKFKYGFKVLKILERKSVVQQKKLNREMRLKTIENAYMLCSEDKRKKILKNYGGQMPEEVCILDDVTTTGATLECCAKILKDGGVQKVKAITLFIVD